MSDLIDRQTAIDAVISLCDDCDSGYCGSCRVNYPGEKDVRKILEDLPSAQPEEAIPVTWLEEEAKWFESMDNAFAKIEATNIRVMIKKWRVEKDERSDKQTSGD